MSNNWAIVIGVNNYDHFHESDHLKYAVHDAESIKEFLHQKAGFDSSKILFCSDNSEPLRNRRLIRTRPELSHLRRILIDEIQDAKGADNLWFFFSGHGIRGRDNCDYLLPSNGYIRDLEGTAISIDFVIRHLMNCCPKNLVMALDMCRSSDGAKGVGSVGAHTEKASKQQGITTIFSCSQGEKSYEIPDLQHGSFTYALLEGLAEYNTAGSLEQYLQQRVPQLNRLYGKHNQLPHISLNSAYSYDLPLLPQAEKQIFSGSSKNYPGSSLFSFTSNQNAKSLEILPKQELVMPFISNALVFIFEVVTVDTYGREINRCQEKAQYLIEDINGVPLEMVVIPGGTFLMGSSERRSLPNELPAHLVTVKPFLMSKYPVTKAQWKAIANLPQVHCKLNKVPVRAGSASHPVAQISWYEAVEFCDRLSRKTGHEYRLPTESEWEYACRAGTKTPFHFGETITPELANYDGKFPYRSEPKGIHRGQTTHITNFKFANAFGLFDMHGNVWEWCQDHWHESYNNAPTHGEAWLDNENSKRVMRGGSWLNEAFLCRSAFRQIADAYHKSNNTGFRIVRLLEL